MKIDKQNKTWLTDLGDSPPKFESVSSLVRLVRIVTVLAWLAGLTLP
mgnify:CR=1 FL=1